MTDIDTVLALLDQQREEGLHPGAQLYVSLGGEVVCDVAVGEARAGVPLRPDHITMWYSSTKPLTAVAILQLVERGDLRLDDPVGRYVAGWGSGKEACTVRHVLTHMGGFARAETFDEDLSWEAAIARIAAHPAEYEPGTRASYHPTSGWKVLGEIVRVVDSRPVEAYLDDEVMRPAGMVDSWLGIPLADQERLAERLAPVHWTGHVVPVVEDGELSMRPYHVEEVHDRPWHRAKVEPGGAGRGPAADLGRFYEALLLDDARRLFRRPETVSLLTACHRVGIPDTTFLTAVLPYGLGVQVAGGISGRVGYRAFGHGGMASSRGLCDPVEGLVMVLVCNGLPGPVANDRRMTEVTDAVYAAVCPRPRSPRIAPGASFA
ncbi:MAG TPA: serine hydrolase domain-containing protein [Acidimicrobiales bacterium]|nr:serine hydrolase domain-containing protein [Acidimicrobiales bacterium]